MVEPSSSPARVAVIQTAFLGDVVFTSPLVRAIKAEWPRARVTLVTTPRAACLARCVPGVDEVIGFAKRGEDRGLQGLRRTAAALGRPEVVFVPHPSVRSAALARMSGAAVRVGPRGPLTRWFYTHPVVVRRREPFVERYLDLARALGFEGAPELKLVAPAEEAQKAAAQLGGRPALGLVVGSEWATKRWPPESFAALADRAVEAGWRPVLLGAPSERPIAAAVCAAARAPQEVLDLVGNAIPESVGLLSQMKAAIGGDSGLLHVARALGTPTLMLFGPTDPGALCFEPHSQALRLGLECQPCHRHGPQVCPRGHHDCMRRLTVDRVWDALTALLARMEAA